MSNFAQEFLSDCQRVLESLDPVMLEHTVDLLLEIRQQGGRLFVVGSGGGAGHASHATSDFRKLCGIQAIAPYDNVSELTARVNDNGWASSLRDSLLVSKIGARDALLVFSVGGGDEARQISLNLVEAVKLARECHAKVIAVVGRDGGYVGGNADAAIIISPLNKNLVTPITEGMQAIVWHLLVSHPKLQIEPNKWEGQSS